MSSFWGNSFIWRDTPSELYGLRLYSDVDSGLVQGSSGVELITEKPFRRVKNYLLGVSHNPNLNFTLSFYREEEITAPESGIISKWLFGHSSFGKLQIEQEDLEGIFFNCILNNPQELKVGGILHGYTCEVQCDSPFAWTTPESVTYTYTSAPALYIGLYNKSDFNGYCYPTVEFVTSAIGGTGVTNISLANWGDNNRIFKFTGLNANEKIIVNNELQTVDSYVKNGEDWVSSGLKRLSNMANNTSTNKNKIWLRLAPGRNLFYLSGNIVSVKFTISYPKKIGG